MNICSHSFATVPKGFTNNWHEVKVGERELSSPGSLLLHTSTRFTRFDFTRQLLPTFMHVLY